MEETTGIRGVCWMMMMTTIIAELKMVMKLSAMMVVVLMLTILRVFITDVSDMTVSYLMILSRIISFRFMAIMLVI